MTPAKAKELLVEDAGSVVSPSVDKTAFASRLEQFLKDNNTKCFLVNSKDSSKLATVVDDAFNGNVVSFNNQNIPTN